MPHDRSVFHAVLEPVPWEDLDRLVERHGAGPLARGFGHRSHLVAMLYGQLSGAASLREIEAGLLSHAGRLAPLGAAPAARATLAGANRRRPAAVFCDLFALMLERAGRGARRAMAGATLPVDATVPPLNRLSAAWARASATLCGAKLHVAYDPDADRPVYAAVTPARVNDITAAGAMPVVPGATYVFDLGDYDDAWWAALDRAGCTVVTRLKSNTAPAEAEERPVPAGGGILSDRVGRLPVRQARNRRNPMGERVREVRVRTETGKVSRVVTNDLDAPAAEVAGLYKRRWAVELFFRWVKQTLKITRFVGTSENAVRVQVAAALIAHLLLRLAQARRSAIAAPLLFARLVRATLMHPRTLDALLRPDPNPGHGRPAPA